MTGSNLSRPGLSDLSRPGLGRSVPGLSRRGLLLLGVGALAGCSASSGTTGSAGTPAPTSPGGSSTGGTTTPPSAPGSPSPSSTPSTPALPTIKPWTPGAGEVKPEVKVAAVRATEDLLSRDHGRSAVAITDAQYGGILSDSASVLVVCRQYYLVDGKVVTGGTTVDVRLSRSGQTWRVTALNRAKPGAAAKQLTAAANRVLSNDRITLPAASIADVRSGQVHDTVLNAMLSLAENYRIGVSVIRSGHPINVFGTDRPSDHPRGRAFDTWQINGLPVVAPTTSRSLITGYMRAAASAGSYNVGGPVQLNGSTYFSDTTHHDHIHAGFTT